MQRERLGFLSRTGLLTDWASHALRDGHVITMYEYLLHTHDSRCTARCRMPDIIMNPTCQSKGHGPSWWMDWWRIIIWAIYPMRAWYWLIVLNGRSGEPQGSSRWDYCRKATYLLWALLPCLSIKISNKIKLLGQINKLWYTVYIPVGNHLHLRSASQAYYY